MPVKSGDVININIPRLSKGRPKGIKVVPQSSQGFAEYYVQRKDEQGQTVFQLAGDSHRTDHINSDTASLEKGFITITALSSDMTNYKRTNQFQKIKW